MKEKKIRTERETLGGERLCWFGDSGWGKGHLRPEKMNFSRNRKEVLERSRLGTSWCKWREGQVLRSRGRGGVGPAGAAEARSQSILKATGRALGRITGKMQRHWRVLSTAHTWFTG